MENLKQEKPYQTKHCMSVRSSAMRTKNVNLSLSEKTSDASCTKNVAIKLILARMRKEEPLQRNTEIAIQKRNQTYPAKVVVLYKPY